MNSNGIQSVKSAPQPLSPEDALAALAACLGEIQVSSVQNDYNGRQTDAEVAKQIEDGWKETLQKVQDAIAAYEAAKAASEEPTWKRVLMGIATLGMSEAVTALGSAITDALEAAGMPETKAKIWGQVFAVAVVVVAVALVAAGAGAMLASQSATAAAAAGGAAAGGGAGAADGAAAGGAGAAADVGSDGVVAGTTEGMSLTKLAAYTASMSLGSTTEIFPKIAEAMGMHGDVATYFGMALQLATCLVLGGYGAMGEGGVVKTTAKACITSPVYVRGATVAAYAIEGGSSIACGGYGIEQGLQLQRAARDLQRSAEEQSKATILNAVMEMFVQGSNRANDLLVDQLQQSPLTVARSLADGYSVPSYLEHQTV